VLGCTHFPLVRKEIAGAFAELRETAPFARDLISEKIEFVNPAELTAKELFRSLASARLRLKPGETSRLDHDEFFISVPNPACQAVKLAGNGALDATYKYGRSTGRFDVEDTKNVPMQISTLPKASVTLIQDKLPEVAKRLK
jgi:glutamate racemase